MITQKFRILVTIIASGLFGCVVEDDAEYEVSPIIKDMVSGVFLDSPVSGLSYSTRGISSFTDKDGVFKYYDGEAITFYLGNTILGTAKGSSVITPLDLSGSASGVVNRLSFLQSLDSDENAANGIEIDQAVRDQYTSIESVNFDQSFDLFFQQTGIEGLKSADVACRHFLDSLASRAKLLSDFKRILTDDYKDSGSIICALPEIEDAEALKSSIIKVNKLISNAQALIDANHNIESAGLKHLIDSITAQISHLTHHEAETQILELESAIAGFEAEISDLINSKAAALEKLKSLITSLKGKISSNPNIDGSALQASIAAIEAKMQGLDLTALQALIYSLKELEQDFDAEVTLRQQTLIDLNKLIDEAKKQIVVHGKLNGEPLQQVIDEINENKGSANTLVLNTFINDLNSAMVDHINSPVVLPEVVESNGKANVAFVLRGYDDTTLFPGTNDFRLKAQQIMTHVRDLSFGNKFSYRLWENGIDSRGPDYFQSLKDIEVLDAAAAGWPEPKWSWVRAQADSIWLTPTSDQLALIARLRVWILENKKSARQWRDIPENRDDYTLLSSNVLRMGGSATAEYLDGLRMPTDYKPEEFDITLIILSSSSTFNLAGAQSSLQSFGVVASDGSPLRGRAAYVGFNTGSENSSIRTSVHEAIHAFGMGTHDYDPGEINENYSVMRQGGAIDTLPVKNRINLGWLPSETITSNPLLVKDLKGATDSTKKYLLEIKLNHYQELYDGNWIQYEDRNGTMYYQATDDNARNDLIDNS